MAASDVELLTVTPTNMLEAQALRTLVPSMSSDSGVVGMLARDNLAVGLGKYSQDGNPDYSSGAQGIPLHRSDAFLSALWLMNTRRPFLGNFGNFVNNQATTPSKLQEKASEKPKFAARFEISKRNNRFRPYPARRDESIRHATKQSALSSQNDRKEFLRRNKSDFDILKNISEADTSYSPLFPYLTNTKAVLTQLGMNKSVVIGCSEKQYARTFNFRYLTCKAVASDVLSTRDNELQKQIRKSLKSHGICVIDRLLGDEIGTEIKSEMISLHANRSCTKGELLGRRTKKNVRGDIITWADGSEPDCVNLRHLCRKMDAIVAMGDGVTEGYNICGGTKAMVARYPGNGTRYQLHVDNPAKDGRCLTCIYYLNKNWNTNKMGGNLRFHAKTSGKIANISPDFDRIVIFYSDSRNPHEVLPTYANRYAVTLWYFDREERAKAIEKFVKTK